ncbi:TGF-beta receptor type I/II extracellular region [Hymenobacter roseosalivarius DSM 11622]|uniref:TGF-beta receptor type I/II extracellular region n=1 Tax=Hymenobacter roseosalivarius DSM 11622 TaxID=645990 RepID=A0A1W1W1E5_9BACT|nr:POT family MFS transporter [Hymenobacter roseosalivarius]SMB99435.1 TGF-beta receptor type I/II extracellular region [Hymenobacter roseosalivarius DSM 11622]
MPTPAAPAEIVRFPKAVPFIIGNEVAERFSYYGMRAILPTFLVAQFFNPGHDTALTAVAEARANDFVHSFAALGYALPVVGALLADWVVGKYRVILYLSLLYCVGHALLAAFVDDLDGFRLGLLVVAVGMGGIKSSVTANLGDQFDRHNAHLLPKAYGWFQLAIDVGAALSTAFIPELYARYGPAVAFGVPGLLMGVATLTFWLGRRRYVRVPPTGLLQGLRQTFGPGEGRAALRRVGVVFIFIPVVWALYDQSVSEWVLQAAHLDRELWPGFTPLPEQIQILGIVFGIGLNPLLTYRVYPALERMGVRATPLRRMGAGMVIVALALAIVAGIQHSLDSGGHPSVWWQVLAYFVVAGGTLMVAVTGLEYAYTHSPQVIKSLTTALWLLTIAGGNFFLSIMNSSIAEGGFFARFQGANYYWFFVGLMAINVTLFALVAARLREKIYVGA